METMRGSLRQQAYLNSLGSEQIGELDALGQYEFDILSMILEQRRPLPVYRLGLWHCHDCHFYTTSIETMWQHLLLSHDPAPPEPDDDGWH